MHGLNRKAAKRNSARGGIEFSRHRPTTDGVHFNAARHPTAFASSPDSVECVRTPVICVRACIKTDAWPDETIPAQQGRSP